jgi:hypothetical protein
MNMVREVNGYEINLDQYEEITDPKIIASLEDRHYNKHTKKYVFDYRANRCIKVGEKWYFPKENCMITA